MITAKELRAEQDAVAAFLTARPGGASMARYEGRHRFFVDPAGQLVMLIVRTTGPRSDAFRLVLRSASQAATPSGRPHGTGSLGGRVGPDWSPWSAEFSYLPGETAEALAWLAAWLASPGMTSGGSYSSYYGWTEAGIASHVPWSGLPHWREQVANGGWAPARIVTP